MCTESVEFINHPINHRPTAAKQHHRQTNLPTHLNGGQQLARVYIDAPVADGVGIEALLGPFCPHVVITPAERPGEIGVVRLFFFWLVIHSCVLRI